MAKQRRTSHSNRDSVGSRQANIGARTTRTVWALVAWFTLVVLLAGGGAYVVGRSMRAAAPAAVSPSDTHYADLTEQMPVDEEGSRPSEGANDADEAASAHRPDGTAPLNQQDGSVRRLRAQVVSTRPHDPSAFTQGLLLHQGTLYESTGMYGESSLRAVDPHSGQVLRQHDLDPALFGEGLARIGDTLVQLTWRAGVAPVYDRVTFEETDRHSYAGDGWGLCFDGARLIMSDGSDALTFRDPTTFEPLGLVAVTLAGQPVAQLNELECVGDMVYANVWQTDNIVAVDAGSGQVISLIDASGLLTPDEQESAEVLNGIAYDAVADTFLITGKWWPKLFEVQFVPARQAFLPGVITGF